MFYIYRLFEERHHEDGTHSRLFSFENIIKFQIFFVLDHIIT